MNMFERIAERLRGQKKGQEQAYWDTIAKIVATKDARTINALTDTLGPLGQAVGKQPSDIERDLASAAKLAELCNAQERETTARKALRTLLNRSAGIEAEAVELEQRARKMRADHAHELMRARVLVTQAEDAKRELASVREALAASGHAESIQLIEQNVAEQSAEVVHA
jgi:predicted  nucleic acid-binding Zn-ribbon protein